MTILAYALTSTESKTNETSRNIERLVRIAIHDDMLLLSSIYLNVYCIVIITKE